MPEKKSSPKKGSPAARPAVDPQVDPADVGLSETDSGVITDIELDDWAEFFAEGDEQGSAVVQLLRVTPDVTLVDPETGLESRTVGYCADVPRGLLSLHSWVKDRFGGGLYQVQKRVNGVIRKVRAVRIQGPPLLGPPPKPAAPAVTDLPTETYDGLNVGGTGDEWEARLSRLMIMKKILADPPAPASIPEQLVDRLLLSLIDQKTPDPLNQIQTLASIISAVKDIVPQPSTGATMTDLFNTALGTVGELLTARRGGGLAAGPVAALARPRRGALTASAQAGQQAAPVDVTNTNQSQTQGMSDAMAQADLKPLAAVAIQTITASFRLDPPIETKRVVAMLDNSLSMAVDQRQRLASFKEVLFDLAETQMEEDFAADPEVRSRFEKYFSDIFSSFVDPQREVVTL